MSEDVGRKTLRSPFFFNDCRHSRQSSILFFFFVCVNDFERHEKQSLMLQRALWTKQTKKKKKPRVIAAGMAVSRCVSTFCCKDELSPLILLDDPLLTLS